MMYLDDVTCLIPLYKSNRHLQRVIQNIDSHIALGGHVLCSDEHCLDDAAQQIADRYAGNPLVGVLMSREGGNWVSNCNRLIAASTTPFIRIMPHDDSCEGASTAHLAQVLRNQPEVVLSHGWVLAENDEGQRLKGVDVPRFPLRPHHDRLQFSAGFFWAAHYEGAFKTVVRRNVVAGEPLLIRPTPTLRHSERAWLFGYSLLGEFAFSHHAWMTKRYWQGSVADAWTNDASDFVDVAEVMASYAEDFLASEADRRAMCFNLYLNAVHRANWIDGLASARPPFEPLTPRLACD